MIRTQTAVPNKLLHVEAARPKTFWMVLNNVVKRLFDFVMALLGILFLSPFLALVCILIKKDSPGPIFYWGARAGYHGRTFKILKFRTMYERPESYAGPRVTAKDDDRITPLGAWLRYTKINELPQLWNVLIGEMSLVGPRPEDADIAKNWPEDVRREIFSVRPGITSPASILYHDEEKLLTKSNIMEDYFQSILPDKMRLDRLYVRYHSFFSDLDIIFWTMAVLIPRLANAKIPEGYLFAGPFSRLINRYVNWFLIDLLVSAIAVAGTCLLWRTQAPLNWGFQSLAVLAMTLAFLFSGMNALAGLNRILWSRSTSEDGVGLLLSGGVTVLFVLVASKSTLVSGWFGLPPLPLSMLLVIGMMAEFGFIAARYRLRLVTSIANHWLSWRQNQMAIGERVLIIGAGEGSQIAGWLLKRRMFRTAFSIVGMVDDNDPTTHGLRISGHWMLGGITDLPTLVEKHDIGVILSTIPATNPKLDEYIFDFCRAYNIRLIFLDDLLRMVDKQVTQPVRETDYPIWRDEHLEFKAVHDVTTQLPNRFLLQDRLRHSLSYSRRYNTRLAVMFIELEDVKSINDTLGRKYGDEVLIQASRRLIHCKRESDTLARFGDHQFALILEHLSSDEETDMIAQRIHASLSKPFQINGHRFNVDPRMGVCLGNELTTSNNISNVEIATCYSRKKIIEIKQHDYQLAQ
jgi:diguanylate cyclase (GGDEF)-like protein